jgi:histidine triad (HIT) family protein
MPTFKVYEDQGVIGALDANPAVKGHTIVIPKKHYTNIFDMPMEEYMQLFGSLRMISSILVETLKPQGLNILYSFGPEAGQRVPHAFIHIIPRYKDDKIEIGWKPIEITQEELTKLQMTIVEALKSKFVKPEEKLQEAPKPEVKEEPIDLEDQPPRYF